MPNINSIPEVLYQADQPYHYHYDNLPLKNILTRIGLVNIQVDTNSDILRGACGSVGSLNSRLDVSLNDNGTIKETAVDATEHNIAHHTDGEKDGTSYVRMLLEERSKLDLIESQANKLFIQVEDTLPTVGSFVTIDSGILKFKNSSTIFFDFIAPDTIKAHSLFPADYAHRHHYDLTPAYTSSPPDYINYKTTSLGTSFVEGSLKVYVNGIRITSSPVLIPNMSSYSGSAVTWKLLSLASQDYKNGTFALSATITASDVIRIDFDEKFSNTPSSSSSSSSAGSSSSS